ncbi:MAG: IS3 family transposase, partial [Chloroflexota bacterium]|nr:IS3 family transposase [Chloroflexota bacterium]
MSRYRFVQAEKAEYPVTVLCRVLQITRSGYYAWARRGVSARATADKELIDQITPVHKRSRRTYGAPRVHAALQAAGVRCGRRV